MKTLLCIAILFLNYSLSLAHSCITYKNLSDKEYNKKLGEVNEIFEGEIVSVIDLDYQVYLIKLKVFTVWKGNKASEITVKYVNPCSSQTPSIGEKLMVYGYKQENETYLSVNCCQPFDNARMKIIYGDGEMIEHSEDISQLSKQDAPSEGFWLWLWIKISSFFSQ